MTLSSFHNTSNPFINMEEDPGLDGLHLDQIPTEVLIRLWFRKLWQKYDAGGINAGRSLRCDLLDCYLESVPTPKLPFPLDHYSGGVEKELLRRPIIFEGPSTVVRLKDVRRYPKKLLARAALGALLSLEWSVDADTAFNNGYELERVRMKKVLQRFDFIEVLLSEVREVSTALIKRKKDIEYRSTRRRFERLSKREE